MSAAASRVTTQALQALRAKLTTELQAEQWYTVLAAASTSAHIGPEALPLIYHMAVQPSTPDAEAVRVQRRLKEALIKCSVLCGIAATLDSSFALMDAVRKDVVAHPGRNDTGFYLRKGQDDIGALRQRGRDQLEAVYRHNLEYIESQRFQQDMIDIKTLTMDINYGWILSENSVLDFPSTALVILASLVPQNLRLTTLWHLRGSLRAGWARDAVTSVRDVSVELTRDLGSRPTHKVPTLDEVSEGDDD